MLKIEKNDGVVWIVSDDSVVVLNGWESICRWIPSGIDEGILLFLGIGTSSRNNLEEDVSSNTLILNFLLSEVVDIFTVECCKTHLSFELVGLDYFYSCVYLICLGLLMVWLRYYF